MEMRFTFGMFSLGMLDHTRVSRESEGFEVREEVSTVHGFELHTLVAVAPKHAPVKFTRAS